MKIGYVKSEPSPVIRMFYDHHPVLVTCDCGATAPLVRLSTATRCNFPIHQAGQLVKQADGSSEMEVCGEVHVVLSRGSLKFKLDALVVRALDSEVLGGMPFLNTNNMCLDIPNSRILVDGGRHSIPSILGEHSSQSHNSAEACLIRADRKVVVMPGEYVEFPITNRPDLEEMDVSIEPHGTGWPEPDISCVIARKVRIPNLTELPVVVQKHQHVAQIRPILTPVPVSPVDVKHSESSLFSVPQSGPFSSDVPIDPDGQLTLSIRRKFAALHERYDGVFDPTIGKYNDASGRLRAIINIGKVEPPPCKGRLPSYSKPIMDRMQLECDKLEQLGVLAKPEDIGVVVEYVSPSFLVDKPNGDKRLVTAFNGLAAFTKKPPSRVSNCEAILRFLAKSRYIIKTDMTKQFFQMPLQKKSMKYAGILTPYRGLRVYTRAAMGMPGSTEYLDQLTSRVLGELIYEGNVAKLADDLYVGANDIEVLYRVWQRVLEIFKANNLRLSASKTIICPRQCTVLGWLWNSGDIFPSPHKVNPLSTCDLPKTVKSLRSWLGGAKHLKSCIPRYSSLFAPLETAVAGKESREEVDWTVDLKRALTSAQQAIREMKPITVARPTDKIAIQTDAASSNNGIGAVMYLVRGKKRLLGGYFSCKLNQCQAKWLPCEIEALAIASAVNHWSMDITESDHTTQVLTDSLPSVHAHRKLQKGEFSLSMRLSTFLATLSRFRVHLQHIAGANNQAADYLSRSPTTCGNEQCQVCSFVTQQQSATVQALTVSDVLEGRAPGPYTNPTAWKDSQCECPHLRRVYNHLNLGTRPTQKQSNIRDVKRYLQKVTIGRDNLLVVKRHQTFAPDRDVTVVPRHLLHGLLTALHLRFSHPTKSQLQKVFERYFFALDHEEGITEVTNSCHLCQSLAKLPPERAQFSTSEPPNAPGKVFASDVMKRSSQKILVTRDYFSSYTTACFIPNENRDAYRSGLIQTTADIRTGQGAIIRVDGATALQSMVKDKVLQSNGLSLEIGRLKNPNKNAVADKAIQELETEIRKKHPDGARITELDLASVLHILNSRMRANGLSAREILFQRDYVSGVQLKINDDVISKSRYENLSKNHPHSARSKVPFSAPPTRITSFNPGDIIFHKHDGSKHTARQQYIVSSVNEKSVFARKFTSSLYGSRVYEFKPHEIYKLTMVSDPPKVAPLERCSPIDSEDSDIDIDDEDQPATAADRPVIPDVKNDSRIEDPTSEHVANHQSVPDENRIGPPNDSEEGEGRPSRQRRKPKWMTSGEYVLKF